MLSSGKSATIRREVEPHMKVEYEVKVYPVMTPVAGHVANSGVRRFELSAASSEDAVEQMRQMARRSFNRRELFYEQHPDARDTEIYDEDHLWVFYTFAVLENGDRIRFQAYALKRGGEWGEVDFAWCCNDRQWRDFKEKSMRYHAKICR